ncbi:T6SS immunity protein Tdi1 domain-containing protein [Listeria booriae]|uniref:T6SS immunity protein Tdi1 domain-containing protein n=1 Tax=Listeria booriae TaxID=1552123 RepID=UPI0035E3DFF7
MNQTNIFADFQKVGAISKNIQAEYVNKIPDSMMTLWNEYGLGSCIDGYLKIINPGEYQDILEESYVRYDSAIPLVTTAMGDIIVWEKNKYLNLLNFRRGTVKVIESGFEFFLEDIEDENFLIEELDWNPYKEASEKFGNPAYDECFGYIPLLALGGSDKVENLKKVKLREHILFITALTGAIE